jgi:hypothetical protein
MEEMTMKALLRNVVLLGLAFSAAQGDVLRLRDGRTIMGSYVGGTAKEVWFQSNAVSAEAYPTFLVESVRFGSTLSAAPEIPEARLNDRGITGARTSSPPWHAVRLYLTTIFAAVFWA